MLSRAMERSVSIVGAGHLGITLACYLREERWRIGAVVTRSNRTARAAVRAIGAGRPSARLAADIFASGVILVATPDAALGTVARKMAEIGGTRCLRSVILHTSGALDSTTLAPLQRLGASTGSMHPMQTFTGNSIPNLRGVTFAIEGDARAVRVARQITRALGGVPIAIRPEDKAAYHAAGVLVAGHALALVEAAVQILQSIGFSRRRALETLLPLIRQMLDNFEQLGPRSAWTGPIARGDFAVVAKHRNALRRYPREFQDAYLALALLGGEVLAENPAVTKARTKKAWRISGRSH